MDGSHLPMGGGKPFPDGLHDGDSNAVSGLLVELSVRLNGQHFLNAVILPALQPQALLRRETADTAPVPNSGGFSSMFVKTTALPCGKTAGV